MSKRVNYFDVMKGIAIIAVMMGHYLSIPFLGTVIWSFHMPLFVFISGYFYKQRSLGELTKKNFKSYIVPYIMVWLVLILAETVIFGLFGTHASEDMTAFDAFTRRIISGPYALASNTTLNKPDFVIKIGVIWFLAALFVGEILLNFTLKIKKKAVQIVTVIVIITVACIISQFICLPLGIGYGCAFLIWLYFGFNVKQYKLFEKIDNSLIIKIITPLIWIISIAIQFITDKTFNIVYLSFPLYGLEIIGAVCGILCIRWISIFIDNHLAVLKNILIKLGRNTIWILCIHALDIEMWNYASRFVPLNKNISGVIRIVLDLILAFVIKRVWITIKGKMDKGKVVVNQ